MIADSPHVLNKPHTVYIRHGLFAPHAWCQQHMGQLGHRWFIQGSRFYFRDARDHAWFVLRWAS